MTSQAPARPDRKLAARNFIPATDVLELPHEFQVVADLPGLSAEQIDIRFEDGTLSIQGSVEPRQAEETQYLLREYAVGDYSRSFRISDEIDPSGIAADYKNGVLTLRLPKAKAHQPRKIVVQG
jgi:HSP20 family protein